MSRDKAKDLIGKMKPKVLRLCDRYERSGSGGGQRSSDDEEYGHFDLDNCIEGDDRRNFLGHESSDVLYWWNVLDDEQILHFTLAVLADEFAADSEETPTSTLSATATTTKKRKVTAEHETAMQEFRSAMRTNSETISKGITLSAFDAMQTKIEALQSKVFDLEMKLLEGDGKMPALVRERIQGEIARLTENIESRKKQLMA